MITQQKRFLLFISLFMLYCYPAALASAGMTPPGYTLTLNFDLSTNTLAAKGEIEIPAGLEFALDLSEVNTTEASIQYSDGEKRGLDTSGPQVVLPRDDRSAILSFSYSKTVQKGESNLISERGISLLNNWYPLPSRPCLFTVYAQLPDGFSAITESDVFPLPTARNMAVGHFSKSTKRISFVAGPYQLDSLAVRDDLLIYTMFFPEDEDLAAGYLQAGARFINRYEKEIGPFPYKHYVVVANRLPTGFGLPTYTLLGQAVIRLPFITRTSLAHEIVHSWFGNAVNVDAQSGNWCEGLTTLLADQSLIPEPEKRAEIRKSSILRYQSYRPQDQAERAFSLADFRSASHRQPLAAYRRSVGYDKGAFFFHELRGFIGEERFSRGIQALYSQYRDKTASWSDIQTVFEEIAGISLESFFTGRLHMTELPVIAAKDISIDRRDGIRLHCVLEQQQQPPIPMVVPLEVETASATFKTSFLLETARQEISIELDDRPLSLTIDPEYDLLRSLVKEEIPPIWSRFLGSEKRLIVLGNASSKELYRPFLKAFSGEKTTVRLAEEMSNKELAEHDILFLGAADAACRSLFANACDGGENLRLEVRDNPLNPEYIAAIFSGNEPEHASSIARRLMHYGRYSLVEFNEGHTVTTEIAPSQKGIRYQLEHLPRGGATSSLSPFQQLIAEIAKHRVIYVGENHSSVADHQLQLQVVEALYQRDPHIALGMEMFPSSSQEALTDYTAVDSTMDEKTFLQQSGYFKVWQLDYRYYRDIINFARARHLPIVGLNIDQEIVANVYRNGSTDLLNEEQQKQMAPERDLDMPGYRQRLLEVYTRHAGGHNDQQFSGFIQAQALWDENMAEEITQFLRRHKDYKMVVLAGNQHTRKDSGIPPRVARRMNVKQASLINLLENPGSDRLDDVADYFFISEEKALPVPPRIGIVVESSGKEANGALLIKEISPHGKAGEAGLLEGDILLSVNDQTIEDIADLRIALLDVRAGDMAKVQVSRGAEGQQLVFEVELTAQP